MRLVIWKMAKSLGLLLVTLLSTNCSDPSADLKQNKFFIHEINTSDRLYQYITTGLGFDPADVKDYGEMYVAEGDMMFNKEYFEVPDDFGKLSNVDVSNAVAPGKIESGKPGARTNQTIASYTQRVFKDTQRRIEVSINANVPSNIRPNITEAINKWNSVSCSEIKFQLVTGRRGHLEISDDGGKLTDTPSLVLGKTDLPSGGSPGRTMLLNTDKMVDHPDRLAKVTGLIVHELGHAIGFRHTNWQLTGFENFPGDVQVPQTPAQTDPSSVFNVGLPPTNDFSTNDGLAIRNAYPAFTNTTCRAPFYYYWSQPLGDTFYTTQLTEKGGSTFWNYSYVRIECFMNTSQQSGTVPLYRMYSETNTDHAYRTSSASFSTYNSNGIAGYIYTSGGGGRTALYEFYSSNNKDYAYTVSPVGFGAAQGYVQQGVVGYVYTYR